MERTHVHCTLGSLVYQENARPLDEWGPDCIYMRLGLESRLPPCDKGLGDASLAVPATQKSGVMNGAPRGRAQDGTKLQHTRPS